MHVFTTNVDGPGVSAVATGVATEIDGVKVWYFPTAAGRRLYRSPMMGRAIKARMPGFDLAHLHAPFLWPMMKAARVARAAAIPYVMAPHGVLVGELIRRKSRLIKSAWITMFERQNLAAAAAVHVTSQIEADEIGKLGLAVRRFAMVPYGIDPPPIPPPEAGESPAMEARRPTILSLGRLSWEKGLDRLIVAMQSVPQARLVIAGNDEKSYWPHLEEIARRCGVLDRTVFVGPVHGAEKWRLFASSDIFVLPSYSESFGNVALEAMACGVPVVVTPGVGLASTVSAGAGLVVDGAPEALGTALSRLLASPMERARLGSVGRRIASEQFSWDAVGTQMEKHYELILQAAR